MPRLPTLIRRRPLDLLARRRFAVGVVGALGVAAALICWRTLPPSRRFVPSAFNVRMRLAAFAEHLRDRTLARLCTVGFAVLGTAAALHNHVGFRLQAPPYRLSPTAVGAIFAGDFPLAQGAILVTALGFIIINLIVDLLYGYLDPRGQKS